MLIKDLDKFISQKKLYFCIFFGLILIFLCKNIDIAITLFVAVIFAAALDPLVEKLEKKTNRPLATVVVLFAFLILIAIFILPVLFLSAYEIYEFAKEFPQYVDNINNVISGMPILKSIGVTTISTNAITGALASSTTDIFESIFAFVSQASTALIYIFTVIVLLFFFIVDKEQIKTAIISIFPIEYREKTSNILDVLYKKLSGYVLAQTLVSGSVWITMTLGLLIFKINYAVLLGVISGILSIIPIVGSLIAFVICLMAAYDMGIKYMLIVTILYSASHFIENHMVRPYVYSKFLNIHQVIVFIALIVDAKYQGVLGIILAPAFAMALCILTEELYIKKMEEKNKEKK